MIKKVLLLILATPMLVNAGQVVSKISQVGVVNEQYGMIRVDTPASSKPECAEEFTILTFDKSTPHGQDLYSIALAGFSTQAKLAITYSDSICGLWGSRMLLSRIDLLRG